MPLYLIIHLLIYSIPLPCIGFNDGLIVENGTGLAKQSYHLGGSGGGHGGRGGRSNSGYFSALSYDSAYEPALYGAAGGAGSDGSGGRGGM